jgi:S1-C subfamily serine protease
LALALALSLSAAVVEGGLLLRRESDQGNLGVTATPSQGATTSKDGTALAATANRNDLSVVISTATASVVAVETTSARTDMFGRTVELEGEASGVIIGDSLIVTNQHVVEAAVETLVTFADGESARATVLGADATHDLAVLSAATGDRPAIEIGSSSALQLGDTVVALGYPLGLGITATAGIVSGLDRTIDVSSTTGAEHLEGLFQTDAAINPGNSGGPLIDSAGRLIGISTAAASAASAENIGFAIAIDEALPVIEELAGTAL